MHKSIRISEDIYLPLQKEADNKYEGNMSLLIRMILKDYVRKTYRRRAEL